MSAQTRAEDMAWAKAWLRNAAGNWGPNGRDTETDMNEEQTLEARLQRMHQRRFGAFLWLVANDDRARLIADRLDQLDPAASWRAITAGQVRQSVQFIADGIGALHFGRMLAGALRRHAPQHLGLLPPPWLEESDGQPIAEVVPMRAAAAPISREMKQGPVIYAEPEP